MSKTTKTIRSIWIEIPDNVPKQCVNKERNDFDSQKWYSEEEILKAIEKALSCCINENEVIYKDVFKKELGLKR